MEIENTIFLQMNFRYLFLSKTPGTKPVSTNIWNPLQIPITIPPEFAKLMTDFIILDLDAMLPHLK